MLPQFEQVPEHEADLADVPRVEVAHEVTERNLADRVLAATQIDVLARRRHKGAVVAGPGGQRVDPVKAEEEVVAFPGMQLDPAGRIMADPATGRTGNPKVYAGGDALNGGKEVVNAAQEGKRAARAIAAQCGIAIKADSPMMAGHA